MKIKYALFLLLILLMINILPAKAQYKVVFHLKIPANIPTKTHQFFIAGDFNGWHTSDKDFQFKEGKNGVYTVILSLNKGEYQYKIVRGDWQNSEVGSKGQSIDNRTIVVGKDSTVIVPIANWADNFQPILKKSTAAPNVHFMDTAFAIAVLHRSRRVWIYLPQNYFTSNKKYPVIYMQDGQNVFDEATSFSGEWGVDEYLNSLPMDEQCIVVAIDNGGILRMNEYNPYNNKKFGKGEGTAYASFLAGILKPFVDEHYRTLSDPKYSVVAGSSMGGLISFYSALHYPKSFGLAGIFSPSFWIAPKLKVEVQKLGSNLNKSSFYFYGGGEEPDSMVANIYATQRLLQKISSVKTRVDVINNGIHNEKFWRAAFPAFYRWCLELWK
ncbi:alpha/beta hydrolase-fold protein [Arachidicoccus sp.]|jgi:predicted alpha/beta superfamily hydrolase|uniref:alpha/beta hydrolase-fold protein n=1 Tax=Arachidicoccus sp. TaxID=1872624 RepID=UPI003D19EB90